MEDLAQLKAAPYNPRRINSHDFASLKKSIKELGDLSGLVFNRQTGVMVGGHQRKQAYEQLGGEIEITETLDLPNSVGTVARGYVTIEDEKYTYRVVEWPADKEKLANLAANRISGEWDDDKLAELIYELKDDAHLPDSGFTMAEITAILATVSDVGEDNADLTLPESGAVRARVGDLYQLGEHRLFCGDVTNPVHVDGLMGGARLEMVFTDPPYNVDYQGSGRAMAEGTTRKRILNDRLSAGDFYNFLYAVCKNLLANTSGAFYICMSGSELHNLHRAFVENGGHFQTYIIWAKNHFVMGRTDFQNQYEPVLYGLTDEEAKKFDDPESQIDGQPILYGYADHNWYGGRKQGNVWLINKPAKSPHHPTEKPVTLCARAIRNSSQRGQIVLDTFGGSGSTLVACEKLQRKCYTMELAPAYVDVIIRRWEHLTGNKAKLVMNLEDEENGVSGHN